MTDAEALIKATKGNADDVIKTRLILLLAPALYFQENKWLVMAGVRHFRRKPKHSLKKPSERFF